MPVIRQSRIYRADLKANPDVLYLFGDNNLRKGMGGQASEMRGEPNAIGVRTKWEPHGMPRAFFRDGDFNKNMGMIDEDLNPAITAALQGRIVVIPLDGLGTGLSEMPTRAPNTYAFLAERLRFLRAL